MSTVKKFIEYQLVIRTISKQMKKTCGVIFILILYSMTLSSFYSGQLKPTWTVEAAILRIFVNANSKSPLLDSKIYMSKVRFCDPSLKLVRSIMIA